MSIKIISKNKRAGFDYSLLEKFEVGVVLQGTEVKVLREGKVNLNEAYVMIDQNDEVWAYNVLIPQYSFGNINNHQEQRIKKLLLNKKEIVRIYHEMKSKNLALVVTMPHLNYIFESLHFVPFSIHQLLFSKNHF